MSDSVDMQHTRGWWMRAGALWLCQCAVLVTSNMLNFALIWQLSAHHDAAVALSVAGAISVLPSIVLAPFTGWLVDRYARRTIMIVAELVSLIPLWVTWQWHSSTTAWVVYVVVFVRAIGTTVYTTAWQATWPQIIPAVHLQRLSSMPQVVMGIASLLTPICGAAIVATQQWDWAVLVALSALLGSVVVAWTMLARPLAPVSVSSSWWLHWHEVWGVARAQPGLLGVLVIAVLLNCMIMPVFSLLPYIVQTHVNAGPWALATSEIVGGVGLVCGVALLAWWGGFPHVIHTLLCAVLILAGAFAMIAFLPAQLSVLYVFVGLLGLAGAWMHGPLLTLVQINVPDAMYGRAMAALTAAMNAATPLGILGAGYVVAWWGVRPWAAMVAGVIVVLVVWVRGSTVIQLKGRVDESA